MVDNANLKNEVTIILGGSEVTLRPTFGCLMAIESKTKKSLLKIIDEVNNGAGLLADTVAILKEGAKAAGTILTDARIEEIIESDGILNVQRKMVDFFVTALYGGKTQESQSKKN